ncbi:2-oxo acid dehydrogenase subunit E2 [Thalassoroseus pseudoceratinae]|uniref:2-oxo acid dehydrogenase subunit E2 n=1 Tax=Thalassoroseus pseudoceratinae TaxID=2713176 RepID=UPI00141DDA2A|nr:2-oxo acid dehydrogenase subunit E2 [Thalassoroseus pseudoceratinae]
MPTEFKLPEISEGVEAVDIAEVLVSEGDTVAPDQNVVEVETDKAAMEVPVKIGGRVTKVHVSAGDNVSVGAVLLTIEESSDAAASSNDAPEDKTPKEESQSPEPPKKTESAPKASQPSSTKLATQEGTEPSPAVATVSETALARGNGDGSVPPPAAPSTRRLARELNVDLVQVKGSGAGGRITKDDVKAFVREGGNAISTGVRQPAESMAPMSGGLAELPNFEKFGPVRRQAMNKIAKMSAAHLSYAWQTIPHVTQHDEPDITDMEAARKAYMAGPGKKGPKITMTAIVMKACVAALKAYPNFNCSLDPTSNELILKDYYHLGCAVDTPNGLVVPVIRDCDQKTIQEIAEELTDIAGRARDRKLGLEDMQGGTFTITNLGGIGGTSFTPIVNYPEVAILGLSRGQKRLEMRDGQVVERMRLPLSLSYDHRVINGADAARFMVKLSHSLTDFMALMVQC